MKTIDEIESSLRDFLQRIQLSESMISTVLGALVVVVVGSLMFGYFRDGQRGAQITDEAASTVNDLALDEDVLLPKEYVVQEGDSLVEIAEKLYGNAELWPMIAEKNNLPLADVLNVGQVLQLPTGGFGGEVSPEALAELEQAEGDEDEVAGEGVSATVLGGEGQEIGDREYVVQAGDTLELIAERAYGRKEEWPRLLEANGLRNGDYLYEGQVLVIPGE